MRKIKIHLFIFVIFLILSNYANAQQGWGSRNPLPQGSVYQLDFKNVNTGYGVCDKGLVIKTTNGGNTWILIRSFTGKNLYSLYFLDNNTGYVVGDSGIILYTTNSGANWFARNSGISEALKSVKFINPNTGFITGTNGKILKTINSGLNWSTQILGTNQLNNVFFLNSNTGFIAGSGGLFAKTTNTGINWQSSNIDTSTLRSVHFTGIDTGYLAGSNGIYKTVNGGLNWFNIYNLYYNRDMYCLNFVNSVTGYCVGKNNPILKTTDSGGNWFMEVTGINIPYTYFNICLKDTVGYISGTDGYILKSSANTQWSTRGGTRHNVNSMVILSAGSILGCADNQTLLSSNGGVNWLIDTYGQANFFEPLGEEFKLLSFSNANNVYRVVKSTCPGSFNEYITRSTDQGLTWNMVGYLGYQLDVINDIQAVENSAYALHLSHSTGHNYILKSVSGTNWITLFSNDSIYFNRLSFFDINTGIVTGQNIVNYTHILLRTTNAGSNWARYTIDPDIDSKIQLLSPETVIMIKNNGTVHRSTNGGINWSIQSNLGITGINDFYFANYNTGWAAGNNGTIRYTTNSGNTFDPQISGTTQNLRCISFLDELNGVIGGDSGTVLKTTTGGITYLHIITEPVPNAYSLSQNYPNPFNPLTKILFAVPGYSFVKLSIYDINGKLISVPVNGYLNRGFHEVLWNGINCSSGVYFYKIESGNFTQSKKMVLIK